MADYRAENDKEAAYNFFVKLACRKHGSRGLFAQGLRPLHPARAPPWTRHLLKKVRENFNHL